MKFSKSLILIGLVVLQMSHFACDGPSEEQKEQDNNASSSIKFQESQEFQRSDSSARATIHQLIGKLIKVKRGAFSYMDDMLRSPILRWVSVPHDFLMPENDITQEQYDLIASLINTNPQAGEQPMPTAAEAMNPDGSTPNFVGPRKPMGGLNVSQWQRYLTKLNEVLAPLWASAYPGQTAPVFRLPVEAELRLAMSDPLERPEGGYALYEGVPINSAFSTFSGTNVPARGPLTEAQEEELRRYVVYGREWSNGPLEVDDPSILPNKRGFRNLSGNILKLTSTPYSQGGVALTVLSGFWSGRSQGCRVAYRWDVLCERVSKDVGLHLVGTLP